MRIIPSTLQAFAQSLSDHGLNLTGVCSQVDAQLIHAEAPIDQSVVVIGSGGTRHFEAIPPEERTRPDPLDRHAERVIENSLSQLPTAYEAVLLIGEKKDTWDLRRVAEAAGFGVFSPHLEMLIHPQFGPWISIRALVLLSAKLDSTPLDCRHPCQDCPRPCLSACPVDAYGTGHPFAPQTCAHHRFREDESSQPCARRCHSRDACPVGRDHEYGADEKRHRHRASLPLLRKFFGS